MLEDVLRVPAGTFRCLACAPPAEDAAVLTRALQSTDAVADALQLYELNRIDRTSRIVKGSDANRTLFHMRDQEKLRQAFAARDEGADRNAWLYSYNPLTVTLT